MLKVFPLKKEVVVKKLRIPDLRETRIYGTKVLRTTRVHVNSRLKSKSVGVDPLGRNPNRDTAGDVVDTPLPVQDSERRRHRRETLRQDGDGRTNDGVGGRTDGRTWKGGKWRRGPASGQRRTGPRDGPTSSEGRQTPFRLRHVKALVKTLSKTSPEGGGKGPLTHWSTFAKGVELPQRVDRREKVRLLRRRYAQRVGHTLGLLEWVQKEEGPTRLQSGT